MGFLRNDRSTSGAVSQRARLQIAAASPLFAMLLAEAFVRLHWRPGLRPTREQGVLVRPHADPRIRFENAPGAVQRLTYDGGRDADPIEVVARINHQGFRGPSVSIAKEPRVFRIACVGDSHTFGHGVDDDRTWPRTLQRELDREFGPLRVEVMNWGVNGYDTEQEVAQIEERLATYRPDLVLLQFFVNDTGLHGALGEPEEGTDDGSGPAGAPEWLVALARHSRCAEFLAARLTRKAALHRFHRSLSERFAADHAGWARCRELLTSARDSLQKAEVEFAVVLYPFLFEWDGEMLSHGPLARVGEFCRDASIPCIDLEPAFDGHDVDSLRVHPLDFHANERAHDIAGRAVGRALIEGGLVRSALEELSSLDARRAEPDADSMRTEDR